ncbi:MAG: aminopeptidase P N-terminal domain-containing protein [Flavisolibacter sp.]
MHTKLPASIGFYFFVLISIPLFAQQDLPQDYLPKEFHKDRREAARALMPANSVMVVFAAPKRTFSNDIEYFYHQNPDLYYFTGYKEPNSVLLIFKEEQNINGKKFNELFFVQKRNPSAEQWTGKRLGTDGVKNKLGIENAFNGEEFKNLPVDLSKFNVLFDGIPEGLTDEPRDFADLYDLVGMFKQKIQLNDYNSALYRDLNFFVRTASSANIDRHVTVFKTKMDATESYRNSELVKAIVEIKSADDIERVRTKIHEALKNINAYDEITSTLREVKTKEELDLIRKAVEISCIGQNEVMKAVRPDMSELEIQGLHEYVHKRYGAEEVGYGSIVGAGENGCILHYMENTKTRVGTTMLLMDVGAEYHGYTADVTRTIPVDGKFSSEERAVYQLVYDAQEAAFRLLKDGAKWAQADIAAREVITKGLVQLGIAKTIEEANKYYPHGLSHHIGLDVHDKGISQTLKKDMVITIEPGIYIPAESNCDKKWWGISVRIEDDALITQDGYELLSSFAPRSIPDIEKMIAEKSLLDNYKLPALKTAQKKTF